MTTETEGYPRPAYAWTTVAILMVAYVFSFIDRQILNLLVGPIRRDLAISDTAMSLLMGFSFAVFYTVFGIPLGRLADSRSRRGIIAIGVFFWSLMTANCALARQYWQFLLFRMGVGVGEAALSPSAYSLIADSFPRETRATAISVYSMGIYLGTGIAYLLGGLVIQFVSTKGDVTLPLLGAVRPWQLIFLLLGAAGVLFTPLLLVIREPLRRGAGAGVNLPMREVAAYLRANRATLACHNFGFALMAFAAYGAAAWVPSFFIRIHGWSAGKIGVVYGGLVAVFGALGIVAGGRLADWLIKRGHSDGTMRVGVAAAVAAIPFALCFPLAVDASFAVALMVPVIFLLGMPFGAAPAAIQEIMPNALRGQASALYLFVINLIGLGLGPTAVALCTDYLFHDDKAVGQSLQLVNTLALAGAALLLAKGLKPYRDSLERLQRWSTPNS